ncbi:MAG: hypothetical protein ACLFQS_01610 [Bacteroidales bacterium]
MELKKLLILFFRITIYWLVATFFATLLISIFSSFIPFEKLQSFIDYRFDLRSLRYFELTIQFYLFVSFLMAAPGYLINLGIYFFNRNKKNLIKAKYISIVINLLIAGGILIAYNSFNISRQIDLIYIIAPVYLISLVGWAILILPTGTKDVSLTKPRQSEE